jgi:hypothetical protein
VVVMIGFDDVLQNATLQLVPGYGMAYLLPACLSLASLLLSVASRLPLACLSLAS